MQILKKSFQPLASATDLANIKVGDFFEEPIAGFPNEEYGIVLGKGYIYTQIIVVPDSLTDPTFFMYFIGEDASGNQALETITLNYGTR